MILPFIHGILFAKFQSSYILSVLYLSIKSISITINICALTAIAVKINKMNFSCSTPRDTILQTGNSAVYQEQIIRVLSRRLSYYCIVQTITRVGPTWYQLQYGFGDYNYDTNDPSTFQLCIVLIEVIFSPLAGLGMTLIMIM